MAHLLGTIVSPLPVKKFETDKSEQKVYGLAGNVREWCLDPYKPRSELIPLTNGSDAPLVDRPGQVAFDLALNGREPFFVVKGGSFFTDLDQAIVFKRDKHSAVVDDDNSDIGFRVVIDCPPPSQR